RAPIEGRPHEVELPDAEAWDEVGDVRVAGMRVEKDRLVGVARDEPEVPRPLPGERRLGEGVGAEVSGDLDDRVIPRRVPPDELRDAVAEDVEAPQVRRRLGPDVAGEVRREEDR